MNKMPKSSGPVGSPDLDAARLLRQKWDEWNQIDCQCEPAYCEHIAPLVNLIRRICEGTATAPSSPPPIDLASVPVHFNPILPRGHIFMHPDTPKSGVRDPWPPAPAVPFALDGDGRDGSNGDGPFEE